MIFDQYGPVGIAQKEHQQIYPRPGWVEHDPLEIWRNTQEVIREAMITAAAPACDISAVGIANQRETTVVWDRITGKPLCNAIVWQDTRTKDICDELASELVVAHVRGAGGGRENANGQLSANGFANSQRRDAINRDAAHRDAVNRDAANRDGVNRDATHRDALDRAPSNAGTIEHAGQVSEIGAPAGIDRFRDKTGLPLATYFSGPKLRWILENVPGAREGARRGTALFGTIDSWLIWNLSGGARGGQHVTDVTNASRTMLMNLQTLQWDKDLIAEMGVEASMLPRITPSVDPRGWGTTRVDGPFGGEILICGNLGDQQAALMGQCCFDPGESKNTYGTGCFMLMNTGLRAFKSTRGLLTTVAYQIAGKSARYALEGSVAVAGSLVQWLRDNLKLIHVASEVETLAREVPDNGGVYIVPAFSGLFAPHWRSDARGVIAGLTGFSNRNHLARAALESVAFQTRDVVEAMLKDSPTPLKRMKVDGGMTGNSLLMQFQADLLGVPVTRSKVRETTALGAAYAAGLAVGFWHDLDDLRARWREDRTWQPTMEEPEREKLVAGWQKAVERSLGWEA
jgi:glycerol kinase